MGYAKPEIEINFFNHLPGGQVISNVCLPEELSTFSKKISTRSFEAVYPWKKINKMCFKAKFVKCTSTEFA